MWQWASKKLPKLHPMFFWVSLLCLRESTYLYSFQARELVQHSCQYHARRIEKMQMCSFVEGSEIFTQCYQTEGISDAMDLSTGQGSSFWWDFAISSIYTVEGTSGYIHIFQVGLSFLNLGNDERVQWLWFRDIRLTGPTLIFGGGARFGGLLSQYTKANTTVLLLRTLGADVWILRPQGRSRRGHLRRRQLWLLISWSQALETNITVSIEFSTTSSRTQAHRKKWCTWHYWKIVEREVVGLSWESKRVILDLEGAMAPDYE